MTRPVVHAEIRSSDPDAAREFFGNLFGWTYSDGAFPGYSFVETVLNVTSIVEPVPEAPDVPLQTGSPVGKPAPKDDGNAWKVTVVPRAT